MIHATCSSPVRVWVARQSQHPHLAAHPHNKKAQSGPHPKAEELVRRRRLGQHVVHQQLLQLRRELLVLHASPP